MKQKFYNLKDIYTEKANYNLLVGERANGKSWAVKENALYIAYHKKDPITKEPVPDYQFGYVRRWDLELKGANIEGYFSDMIQDHDGKKKIFEITGGEYSTISVWQHKIFFANIDEDGKVLRGPLIGYPFALTGTTHYKSLSFPLVGRLIFEEFITDEGYLPREPKKLLDLVSTIFRRRFGRVFLIGNTINRSCPYFNEWFPDNKILKMKPGEVRLYNLKTDQQEEDGAPVTVKIAVERCENSGNNSKMFFGSSAKMITKGEWEQEEQPHLPEAPEHYKKVFTMFIEDTGLCYMLQLLKPKDGGDHLLYVQPHTTEIKDREKTRVITDQFSLNLLHSHRFLTDLYKYDTFILTYLVNDKIVYSDNLTGTEFKRLLKNRGYFK